MANLMFNESFYRFMRGEIGLISDTIKIALFADTYTPDRDNDEVYGDISAHEIAAGGGYSTGGETLGTKTITKDAANDYSWFDAADVQSPWDSGTFTGARYAVIYKSNGLAAEQYLLYLIDLEYNRNAPMEFNWSSSGIFAIGRCA